MTIPVLLYEIGREVCLHFGPLRLYLDHQEYGRLKAEIEALERRRKLEEKIATAERVPEEMTP